MKFDNKIKKVQKMKNTQKMKKGQAAMEFLMTYGWAILIVLVAIGSIAYFGVLSPETFLPEKCVISTGSGLFCEQFSVSPGEVRLKIRNTLPEAIEVTEASITQDGDSCTLYEPPVPILADGFGELILNQGATCLNLTSLGKKLKGEISITYTKRSFPKTTTGSLVSKVAEVIGGGPVCAGISECGNYSQADCTSPDPCTISLTGCEWNVSGGICEKVMGFCDDGICDTDTGETEVSCPEDCTLYNGDSILYLGTTGYAYRTDAGTTDLDYSKDFSVEVLTKIEPHSIGGRWASFIQKSGSGTLYLSSEPGFAIGTSQGHSEHFGQQIAVKVGDGTNHVTLTSQMLEGYVYAIMTWDSTAKELVLYINGNESGRNDDVAINPLNIANSFDLQIGKGMTPMKRDIFMARLWNRKLSVSEVSNLWNNYDITGQHIFPGGFDNTELHSEWLMGEISNATGGSGTTHIKDTAGNNHLELMSGAEIYRGNGLLTMQYPQNAATGIDKAVYLNVSGGIATLGGSVVKPLQYYFQIDEVNTFNSPNLKESGWIKHYGKYKPILKPNTQYYWRVKVKDSSGILAESAYTSVYYFTTEGSIDWYVRPGVYSSSGSTPVPALGIYGNQDGSDYNNAWNGLREINWGENGVEAGDNLYVCGEHVYNTSSGDFLTDQAKEYIRESGFSEEYPVTIRMDCAQEPGTLYGIWMDNRVNVVWNGPDSNDVYWTDDLAYGAAAEYNGTDYVWLDTEDSTTWVGHPGAVYATGGNTYVKTTDLSNPTGKIYTSDWGFRFDLGRSKYIKFYKGNFYGSTVGKERIYETVTDEIPSTHIIFDSCKMIYGVTYLLYAGHDYWIFRNNDISYAGNGIYTVGNDNDLNDGWGASYLLIENNTFIHLGTGAYYGNDNHAIGVQGGRGHIIQGNYIEDTGAAIEFYSGAHPMKNMTVRNNFIKDIKVKSVTGGGGIVVGGSNWDSFGLRTGFKIYNNIIMNTGIGASAGGWKGSGIGTNNKDSVEIYNNIIFNTTGNGIRFVVMDAPPQGAVYNNIIVNPKPGSKYLYIIGDAGDWSNLSSDYNLYYNTTDFTTDFFFLGGSIDRDNHSILADPMFVSANPQEPADFKPLLGSPVIDNGTDVGLTLDYEGNTIPFGIAPDIGAYEYVP